MDKNIIPFVLKKCFFSLFYHFMAVKKRLEVFWDSMRFYPKRCSSSDCFSIDRIFFPSGA